MSTKDLVNAIIVGDAVEIENAFQATMAEKISARLDDYRQEVAQNMFATEELELDEALKTYHVQVGHPNGARTVKVQAKSKTHAVEVADKEHKKFGERVNKNSVELVKEEVELAEETLTVHPGKRYALPGKGPAKHTITKDHGTAPDGSHVYSVKQPNGFHGVFAVKGSTVVGSSNNNLSKDEAHSLGAHYAKHGAVGIGVGKHWSLGSGIHGKVVKESIELDEEQLDELSKGTLGSYIKKAGQHRVRLAGAERDLDDKDTALQRAKHGADDATYDALSKAQDTMRKQRYKVSDKSQQRAQGISRAVNRLTKEEAEQILASEEFAQLDELSKTTLGNYIKKASGGVKGAMTHAYVAGGGTGASEEGKKKSFDIAQKRLKGVRTAVDKLTKEDVEHLVVTTVESALYAMQDGRNVLDEQMDEAVSSSSKDNYEWTHGNKPKGHGNWFFSTVHPRQHDMQQHKDQTVNVTGTFGDAAKKAQAHFKEKGHKGEIHVLT